MKDSNTIRLNSPKQFQKHARIKSNSKQQNENALKVKVKTIANPALHKEIVQKSGHSEDRLSLGAITHKSVRDFHELLYTNEANPLSNCNSPKNNHYLIHKKLNALKQYNYSRMSLPLGTKLERLLPTDGVDKLEYSCTFFGQKMNRRISKLTSGSKLSSKKNIDLRVFNYLFYRYINEITMALNSYVSASLDKTAPLAEIFPQNGTVVAPVDTEKEELGFISDETLFFASCFAEDPNWFMMDGEIAVSTQTRNQIREIALSLLLFQKVLKTQVQVLKSRNQVLKTFVKEFKDLEEQNYILKDVLNQFLKSHTTAEIVIRRLVEHPILHLFKSPNCVGNEPPVQVVHQGTNTASDWIEKRQQDVLCDKQKYHSDLWKGSTSKIRDFDESPEKLDELAINAWTTFEPTLRISAEPQMESKEVCVCPETSECGVSAVALSSEGATQVEIISLEQQAKERNNFIIKIKQLEQDLETERRQNQAEVGKLQEKVNSLATQMKLKDTGFQEERESLQAQISKLATAKNEQSLKLEALEQDVKQKASDLTALETETADLHETIQKYTRQIQEIKADKDGYTKQQESKVIVLEAERNGLMHKVGVLERQLANVQATPVNKSELATIKRLEAENQTLQQTNSAMATKLSLAEAKLEQSLADKKAEETTLLQETSKSAVLTLSQQAEISDLRRIIEMLMRFPDISIGDSLKICLGVSVSDKEFAAVDGQVCEILQSNNLRISLLEWKNHELRNWRLAATQIGAENFNKEIKPVKTVQLWENGKVMPAQRHDGTRHRPSTGVNYPKGDVLVAGRPQTAAVADKRHLPKRNFVNYQDLAQLSSHVQHLNHFVDYTKTSTLALQDSRQVQQLVSPQHALTASLVRKAVSESALDVSKLHQTDGARLPKPTTESSKISALQYKYAVSQAFKEANVAKNSLKNTF